MERKGSAMTQIDESQLKSQLLAIKSKNIEQLRFRTPNLSFRRESARQGRNVGKVFEAFFNKAGLDVKKTNEMLAEHQRELQRIFQKQKAEAAKYAASMTSLIQRGFEARRSAIGRLPNPLISFVKVLDTPVLILENPVTNLDIFRDSHIEALNSWIKVLVATRAASGGTNFTFYFMWTNDTGGQAVVNASTSVLFNGSCDVSAAPGFFSGHTNSLEIQLFFNVLRWSGWGTDPNTGQNIDGTYDPNGQQSQYQLVAYLTATGGREIIFGGADDQAQLFPNVPFDLSHNWLPVPSNAVTIFEVNVQFTYSLSDGENNISDLVEADFANDAFGHLIKCPQVLLEISPTRHVPLAS
jgi:hypothetical protein